MAFRHRSQALQLRAALSRAVRVGLAGIRSAAVREYALRDVLVAEPCERLVRCTLILLAFFRLHRILLTLSETVADSVRLESPGRHLPRASFDKFPRAR